MSSNTTLASVKLSLRITTDAFDSELNDLIDAALGDLMIAGVDGINANLNDPMTLRAVTTYCKLHFGAPDEYDRLKASYDEQKAQLSMSRDWTTFPGV